MRTQFIYGLLLSISATSCQKYVEIRTKGQLVPSETDNFRYIMNNGSIMNIGNGLTDLAADDIDLADESQQAGLVNYTPYVNYYIWAEKFTDVGSTDYTWDAMYRIIFNCNTVLQDVQSSTNGTQADKDQIYGEALVNRADAYLTLIRAYAKTFDSATAASDPGVPLLLGPVLDTSSPRASVQRVYESIISDLRNAAPLMAALPKNNTLASRWAAFALLSRTFLDMGDYSDAAAYADSTLQIGNTILDMNELQGSIPRIVDNRELIFSKIANMSTAFAPLLLRLSDDMLALFEDTDLRYSIFTTSAADQDPTLSGRIYSVDISLPYPNARNCGVTVPEVMLIRAECLARSGNAQESINLLNTLREKRFAPGDYQPLAASNADSALHLVLNERRRELFCRGFRWYDLKRLNKEPRFAKAITRNFSGVDYTLEPNGNRYVFPIADYYFSFNKLLVQNPR